jgi:hypothetical protein
MKRILTMIMILGLVAGCRQQDPAPTASGDEAPPAPKRAAVEAQESADKVAAEAAAAAKEKADEAEKVKEMLGAHKKKREILVGGCAQRCRAPLDGFRGFARALWKVPDPDEAQPLLGFVDTAELVDGETRHGRGWADLFLEGRLAERREGVEAWRDRFVQEMGSLSDSSELQAALDAPLHLSRQSADVVVIHFALPATDRGAGGEIWHFTFGKRGLEWLLRGVARP